MTELWNEDYNQDEDHLLGSPQPVPDQVRQRIDDMGYHVEHVIDNDLEINLKDNPMERETNWGKILPNLNEIQVQNWVSSSRLLYSMFEHAPRLVSTSARIRGEEPPAWTQGAEVGELSDEEVAEWGVEMMGAFNYAPEAQTKMAYDIAFSEDSTHRHKLAMVELLHAYDQFPNWTWDGSMRMLKYTATSPTSYIALGTTLGAGLVLRQAALQTGKAGLKKTLLSLLPAPAITGAMFAGSVEGGAYMTHDEMMRQWTRIEAGEIDEFQFGDVAAAGGLGMAGGTVLAALVSGAVPAVKAARQGLRTLEERGAFDAAQKTISEFAEDTGGSVPRRVKAEELGDPLVAAGRKSSELRGQEVRSEGGVPFPVEKTDNNLRLHLSRIDKAETKRVPYPGGPKNPRTVIKAPEGSDLPDIVVGQITPDDWVLRIESSMSPEQIADASKWYGRIFGEFDRVAQGNSDDVRKLSEAWLAGQQNETPSNALANVLFIYEQLNRGIAPDQVSGKGLPSANIAIRNILTGRKVEKGVGQKISDFIDAGEGKNVRSIMGNDPQGGSPFVVDVHTGRDTGLVDKEYINHLRRLGYDVPDDIITDLAGGGIKGPQYENRSLFGHQLTDHLNDMNWMGRSDWEPSEVQAIGWTQLTEMYGGPSMGGDVSGALTRSTRRIAMEVDPGKGSPWAIKFGERYKALDEPARFDINEKVTSRAVQIVNEREGINLGGIVHGSGGWEKYTNPSAVQQGLITRETAVIAAAQLGKILNQTEVWVNSAKELTKNPVNLGIDIVEDGTSNLRSNEKLLELWTKITDAESNELVRGYQPIKAADGGVGIRIIIDKDALKAWAKANKSNMAAARQMVIEFAQKDLHDIADGLDYDVQIDVNEIVLDKLKNDWGRHPNGESYEVYIGEKGQSAPTTRDRTNLDSDGAELEKLFDSLISEAEGSTAGVGK
tara:strand:+ start:2037 stop:4865 length:2829 start_codon:yes stop_codon:yes gene_type:complete